MFYDFVQDLYIHINEAKHACKETPYINKSITQKIVQFFPHSMILYHILFIHRAEQPDLHDGQTLIYPVYGISQQFKGTGSRLLKWIVLGLAKNFYWYFNFLDGPLMSHCICHFSRG
jgi:hypothetical protein